MIPSTFSERAPAALIEAQRRSLAVGLRLAAVGVLLVAMAAAGAAATTAISASVWNSMHDLLRRDSALLGHLSAGFHSYPGSPGAPFFKSSLDSFGPSPGSPLRGECSSLDLVALVLDSLACEPMHRVHRGPGRSFYHAPTLSSVAAPLGRGWARVSEALQLWDES